jgi:hypothetical protein
LSKNAVLDLDYNLITGAEVINLAGNTTSTELDLNRTLIIKSPLLGDLFIQKYDIKNIKPQK